MYFVYFTNLVIKKILLVLIIVYKLSEIIFKYSQNTPTIIFIYYSRYSFYINLGSV